MSARLFFQFRYVVSEAAEALHQAWFNPGLGVRVEPQGIWRRQVARIVYGLARGLEVADPRTL